MARIAKKTVAKKKRAGPLKDVEDVIARDPDPSLRMGGLPAWTGAARVLVVPARRERMDEKQLKTALAVPDDDRLLCAVRQILEEEFAEAALEVSSPTLDPSKGTWAGGAIAAVSSVRDRIERLRRG